MKSKRLGNGVTVIELDPTKKYWFIIDRESGVRPETLVMQTGLIIYKYAKGKFQVVENADAIVKAVNG